MPMSKDFEFYNLFNYQIMKVKESGVFAHIIKNYEDVYGSIKRSCENRRRGKGTIDASV